MTVQDLRNLLLQHCLNLGGPASQANEDQHDDRADLAIQWAVNDFVNAYSWSWRLATGTCSVATTGIGPLPADFGSFGAHGMVSINANKRILQRIPEQQLFELLARDSGTATLPAFYCEAGMTVTTPNAQRRIRVYRVPTVAITVNLVYYVRAPQVTLLTGGADADFLIIPAEYHSGPIYEGAAARLLFNIGDPRALECEQRYVRAKAEAWANDHSHHWPRRRPRFGARSGVYR